MSPWGTHEIMWVMEKHRMGVYWNALLKVDNTDFNKLWARFSTWVLPKKSWRMDFRNNNTSLQLNVPCEIMEAFNQVQYVNRLCNDVYFSTEEGLINRDELQNLCSRPNNAQKIWRSHLSHSTQKNRFNVIHQLKRFRVHWKSCHAAHPPQTSHPYDWSRTLMGGYNNLLQLTVGYLYMHEFWQFASKLCKESKGVFWNGIIAPQPLPSFRLSSTPCLVCRSFARKSVLH